MKNLLMFFLAFTLSGTLIFTSCNKKDSLLFLSSESSFDIQHLPHNQSLLNLLNNGESISIENTSEEATLRDDLVPSSINVSVSDNMLCFGTQEDVDNYIEFLDYLVENWDYSNSDIYDDTPDEIYHLGDEALNAVEDELGYHSLRSWYNVLEFNDENYVSSLDFYIADPDYQTILNDNHQVKIEGSCYVWLARNIVAIVKGCDKRSLHEIETFGMFATGPNITIINENTGDPIDVSSTEAEERGDCTLSALHNVVESEGFNTIHLKGVLLGSAGACFAGWEVEWGDGFTTEPNLGIENHTYDVGDLIPGQCMEFTIKVTAVKTGLESAGCKCKPKTYKHEKTINICRILPGCNKSETSNKKDHFFNYEGKEYKIEREIGQRPVGSLLTGSKVWVKSVLKRKKNNGNWRKRKPGKNMMVRVKGDIVLNQCTLFDNVDASEKKRKKKVVKKHKPNQNFHSQEESLTRLFGDYIVEMDDTFGEESFNFPLFE